MPHQHDMGVEPITHGKIAVRAYKLQQASLQHLDFIITDFVGGVSKVVV